MKKAEVILVIYEHIMLISQFFILIYTSRWIGAGHAVAQLVEALRYIPERRGIDSRWCHWNISLT
jgi:hypothetical protein